MSPRAQLVLIKFDVCMYDVICPLTGAVLYYYTYKRTALRLSDPRFYQINEWIIAEFEKKL